MKVILRQNYQTLGQIGDVVEVKDGYALNFLIPRKIAFTALAGNLRALNEEKKSYDKKVKKEVSEAELLASQLEKITIEMIVKVGEEGRLYGTVTTQMVADALTEKGFNIDKRKIEIAEQIKSVGVYSVDVKVYASVTAKVKILVKEEAKQGEEAQETPALVEEASAPVVETSDTVVETPTPAETEPAAEEPKAE